MGNRISLTILLSSVLCAWGCGGDSASADSDGGQDASSSADAPWRLDGPIADDAGAASADARVPALDCLGAKLPTTAPDPLILSGTVVNPGIPGVTPDKPVLGASIELFTRGTDTPVLATDTSTDGGKFVLNAANASQLPMDAYLRSTATSYWTTYLYPAIPMTTSPTGIKVFLTTLTQFELLASYASITADPSKGLITVVVRDCNRDPIEGAVVTTTPAIDEIIYMDSRGTPSDAAIATGADGVALLFNVPVGAIELAASVDGMDLRSHTVDALATNHDGASGDEAALSTVLQP